MVNSQNNVYREYGGAVYFEKYYYVYYVIRESSFSRENYIIIKTI